MHVRQIRRYESGEQQPVLAVAARLAATLEVSLDELAGLAGAPIVLDGEWWAARQVQIDGHDRIVALPVRLTQHGTTIALEGLEPGRGRAGAANCGSGAVRRSPAGTPARRATCVRGGRCSCSCARVERVAEGRWVGVAAGGAVVTGAAALARTRAGAHEVFAAVSRNPADLEGDF